MICVYLIGCAIHRVVVIKLQDTSLPQYQGKIKEFQSFEDIKEPYIIVGKIRTRVQGGFGDPVEAQRKLLLKKTSKLGGNALVRGQLNPYPLGGWENGIAVLTGRDSSQVSNYNRKPFIVTILTKPTNLKQLCEPYLMNNKGYYVTDDNYENARYSLEQIKAMSEKDKLNHFGKETDYILYIEMVDSVNSIVTLYSLRENREIKVVNTEVFKTRYVRREPGETPFKFLAFMYTGDARYLDKKEPYKYGYKGIQKPVDPYLLKLNINLLIKQALKELPDVIGNR